MNSEWMGRYRSLVAALVAHGNFVSHTVNKKSDIGNGLMLNSVEWQILESIIEHQFETLNMNEIAHSLGIPQSSFSKVVKMLCDLGLVDKYQAVNNRKNIILKPSDKAIALYDSYSDTLSNHFDSFFRELEGVSDADLAAVVCAIKALDKIFEPPAVDEQTILIKKESATI